MTNGAATNDEMVRKASGHHVCPWWLGYVLVLPVRRLLESPENAFAPLVEPGMKVLDFGAGMGYFSLPLARLVGPTGKVVCVDMQAKMLRALTRRARRRGLMGQIETVLMTAADGAEEEPLAAHDGSCDLALAMHVIHEVPDPLGALSLLARALKPGGRLAMAEPKGHVSAEVFAEEVRLAERAGLRLAGSIGGFRRGQAVLLDKPLAQS